MKTPVFRTLVAKEFWEAVHARWLISFIVIFCALAFGISWVGTAGSMIRGYSGFGRTTAALVNLVLLIVPLMGLVSGALSLAGERERRTLDLLLVLPVRPGQIFWAKVFGLSLSLILSLSIAFGTAGITLASRGGLQDTALYFACFWATLLLGLISLGLGLWISACSRRIAQAIGLTLIVWLGLVFVGDLGLLGTSLAVRLPPGVLLATAWLNPLTLYRMLSIDVLGANLEMLGPAGQCAQDILGHGLRLSILGGLLTWMTLALILAYTTYRRNPLREG